MTTRDNSINRIKKLSLINEAGQIMNSLLDLDSMLDHILLLVKKVFNLNQCAILLVDEKTGDLKIRKHVGYDEDVVKSFVVRIGEGITGWVAQNSIPLLIDDVTKDPRYIRGVSGAVSEMAVPLKINDSVIGVLDAESKKRGAFSDEDLELLSIVASQAAIAIHNAKLHSELAKKYDELKLLYHVGQKISSVLDIDVLLDEILHTINKALHFDCCAILLREEDSDMLKVRAAMGYPSDIIEKLEIPLGHGVTGRVARTGQPVLIEDVSLEKNYIPGVLEGRCEMAVPLIANGEVSGVLDAESTVPYAFKQHDLELFATFASVASIAIENARIMLKTHRLYYDTIRSLAEALEAKDAYTIGHSERVTKYALMIAEKLKLSTSEKKFIEQAGLLHDIGKIGISDLILNKPTSLSKEDKKIIEDHPRLGNLILTHIKFLEKAISAIFHHHERFDGSGYPSGLKGREIPLIARIIAVADSYDAMTSDRPYRSSMSNKLAIKELLENKGTQFDPEVVSAFMEVLKEKTL